MNALLIRDLRLATRSGGGAGLGLAFFLIVVMLVPFGIGPEPEILARTAPGTLWIAALLACLLSLDRLFQADFEDGSLDIIMASGHSITAIVAIKAFAHWLTTGLPLLVAGPLLAMMLALPDEALPWLVAALAAGTPSLSLLGGIGAALTVGIRRGGLLLSLLTLPLYIPTLILGADTVARAADGRDPLTPLLLLSALSLFTGVLGPVAGAAALRIHYR